MIADNNSTAFVSKLLESGVRLDGRQLFQSRKIDVQFLDKPGILLVTQDIFSTPKAKLKCQ